MGRRLILLVGMALAVMTIVRPTRAHSEPPAADPMAPPATERPPDLPPTLPDLPGAIAPEPVPPPAPPPALIEEPPRTATPAERAPGQAQEKSDETHAPGAARAIPTAPGQPTELVPPPAAPEGAPPNPLPLPLPRAEQPAKRDPQVKRVQAPARLAGTAPPGAGPEDNPLPPAREPPGQSAPGAAPHPGAGHGAGRETERFVLPAEQLPMGRQAVGLTVEVQSPPTLNINKEATLKIVVRNTGTTDAMGVIVRDELPEGLEFLGSQPAEQRAEAVLFWPLNTVPAGSEQIIALRVKPTRVGSFDHAATVTMRAGSKSRTLVREPKLKVEQTVSSAKVLKGQPVQFRITVSNPGNGPVRNVTVQAKLSEGLRHESGETNSLFEQTLDVIEPGQRMPLDPLVADTLIGGTQSCKVVARSDDVTPGSGEAEKVQEIEVVEPKLKLTVAGDETRYTDTIASYLITVENPGTATARNVRVLATLPVSGRLVAVPNGARWDPTKGRLYWVLSQLEPGEQEKVTLPFQVHMGGIDLYQVAVEVRGEGGLIEKQVFKTNVTGLADVDFNVSERRRSIDIGDLTIFQIKIKNYGSKEATRLLISAKLSENIEAVDTDFRNERGEEALYNKVDHEVKFPQVDHLAPGKELTLGIRVRATHPGTATCRVFLMHDDLETRLDDVAATRITSTRR